MSNGQITIQIGGNAQQFAQAANQANQAAQTFNVTINNTINNINNLNGAANGAGRGLGNLGRGMGQAGGATGGANAALTDFNRIIQDSPFGVVGITNNITQLSDSFGRLRQQTGSGGAALRAMFSALTGAGGLGFLITGITTAFTFASVGFNAWTRGLTGSKKATDEAKEAAKEYQKALESITTSISNEAARVGTLVEALKGDTLAKKERNAAIKELQKINPEYFGQLKDEKGLVDSLTKAYGNYLSSLKEQFAAKAIDKQLAALFDQRLTVETRLDTKISSDSKKDFSTLKSNYEAEIARLGGVDILQGIDLTKPLSDAQKRIVQLQQAIKNLEQPREIDFSNAEDQKRLASINKEIDGLLIRRARFGKTGLDLKLSDGKEKSDAELKRLKDELEGLQKQLQATNQLREAGLLPLNRENDALELQLKIFETLAKIDAREVAIKAKPALEIDPVLADLEIDKAYKEFSKRAAANVTPKTIPFLARITFSDDSFANAFSPANLIGANPIPANAFDGVIKAIQRAADNAKARIGEIAIDVKSFIQTALTDAFTSIGEGIGDALSGGGFQSIVGAFVQAIGASISALGRAAVAAGTAALLLKSTIEKFIVKNPALVIAAGVAAIALGRALTGAFNNTKTPGFADGVTNFIGGAALVGERGPEIVTLPTGSNVIPLNPFEAMRTMTLVSEIRGEDIYLSNRRVTGRRRRV